jgi:hypothetical protein
MEPVHHVSINWLHPKTRNSERLLRVQELFTAESAERAEQN